MLDELIDRRTALVALSACSALAAAPAVARTGADDLTEVEADLLALAARDRAYWKGARSSEYPTFDRDHAVVEILESLAVRGLVEERPTDFFANDHWVSSVFVATARGRAALLAHPRA